MTADKTKDEGKSDHIEMLDDLISKFYDHLKENCETIAKIGDLMKMIELRRKLAPVDADQKKFWSMLEDVRRKALAEPEKKTPAKTKATKAKDAKKK